MARLPSRREPILLGGLFVVTPPTAINDDRIRRRRVRTIYAFVADVLKDTAMTGARPGALRVLAPAPSPILAFRSRARWRLLLRAPIPTGSGNLMPVTVGVVTASALGISRSGIRSCGSTHYFLG